MGNTNIENNINRKSVIGFKKTRGLKKVKGFVTKEIKNVVISLKLFTSIEFKKTSGWSVL